MSDVIVGENPYEEESSEVLEQEQKEVLITKELLIDKYGLTDAGNEDGNTVLIGRVGENVVKFELGIQEGEFLLTQIYIYENADVDEVLPDDLDWDLVFNGVLSTEELFKNLMFMLLIDID